MNGTWWSDSKFFTITPGDEAKQKEAALENWLKANSQSKDKHPVLIFKERTSVGIAQAVRYTIIV